MKFKTILFSLSIVLVASLWAAPAKIIGFYPYWVQYSQFTPNDVRYNLLTDINYVGISPTEDGNIAFTDPSDEVNFESLAKLSKENKVNLIIVIGGYDTEEAFKSIATEDANLSNFTQNIQSWIEKYSLAGVELDWQGLDEENKENFQKIVETLLESKKSTTLSLTTYPMDGVEVYDPDLLNKVDYITAFIKDQMSEEESVLKANTGAKDVSKGLQLLTDLGVSSSKIVPIVPLYAKTFMGAKGLGTAHQGIGSGNEGYIPYKDLMDRVFKDDSYKVTFDENSKSEVAVGPTESIVFVGIPTMKAIASQLKDRFAGIAVYDLSQDHTQPLVSLLVTTGLVFYPEKDYKPKKK